MATPAMSPAGSTARSSRGKDQLPQLSEDTWTRWDEAVTKEMLTRQLSFIPQFYVDHEIMTVSNDVVIVPTTSTTGSVAPDPPYIEEGANLTLNTYSTSVRLSSAQLVSEGKQNLNVSPSVSNANGKDSGSAADFKPASTAVSLLIKAANLLAQVDDAICLSGQNALVNHPLLKSQRVQYLDPKLATNLDSGLLNIDSNGTLSLPLAQVIPVHPTQPPPTLAYQENHLDAIAQAVSVLNAAGYYGECALVLNTWPYAELHSALKHTLITPVEPISSMVRGGIIGTQGVPPFDGSKAGLPAKLPSGFPDGEILYMGILIALDGNAVDHVRGLMDDKLEAAVSYTKKEGQYYYFDVSHRHAIRQKDTLGVVVLAYMSA
jgi:hypothetical protein